MRKRTCKWICVICILALSLACVGCSAWSNTSEPKTTKSSFYFDTIISVTLYGTTDASAIDECFQMADRYEKLLSNTVPTSEISQINDKAGTGEYLTVSPETLELLEAGITYGDLSHGSFDITIGKLSALWNFSEIAKNIENDGNETDASVLPSEEKIAELLSHVNYKNIEISGNRVRLNDENAMIDLGGIAKGYIADQMRTLLNEKGYTRGIINLGGNILTLGPKDDGNDYLIGIQKPFGESNETIGAVKISDASVVTSGIYERYYRVDGKLYHHILDTRNGYPCENNLLEVTIISQSSMDGDALSTTCFALGLEEGMALIESMEDTEAIFVTNDNEIHTTSGFGNSVEFVED